VRWSSGGGEGIACDEAWCRLCRGDNRGKAGVDHRDGLDEPRVMGPDGLMRACGQCPGIAEDSTLHWRVA
jgi:hypothetical protein